MYGITHKNHPISLWCSESFRNIIVLYRKLDSINREFKNRYNKNDDENHKSFELVDTIFNAHFSELKKTYEHNNKEIEKLTKFPLCIADQYKKQNVVDDIKEYATNEYKHNLVECYRQYYKNEKTTDDFTWTNKSKEDLPNWLSENISEKQFKKA